MPGDQAMKTPLRKPQNPYNPVRNLEKSFLLRLCQLPAIVLLGALLGCSSHPKQHLASEFKVELHAESDGGNVLQGVNVYSSHRLLGQTNNAGRLDFVLHGTEGQIEPIEWGCPEGYVATEHTKTLRLAHTKSVAISTPQPLKLDATCSRQMREVVVVVHGEQANTIPVMVDGKIASVTSSDGFAQVLLNVDRAILSVTVGLDTNTRPNLKPKNPTRKYDLSPNDTLLIFDQKFSALQPTRAIVRKESRHVPYRVD